MKRELCGPFSIAAFACGAAGWLMLLPVPAWWAGFGCTLAALLFAWRVLRAKPAKRTVRAQAGIGLCSATAAAAVCIAFLHTAPVMTY